MILGHPDTTILATAGAAAVAGFARGFSGFGGALIFMPIGSALLGPGASAALLLVVDAVMSAPMLPRAWVDADRRPVLTMALGAMIGVPLGASILTRSDPLVLRWLFTGLAAATLAFLASGWRYRGTPSRGVIASVGALSGLMGGAAQMGGPPVVAFWLGGVRSASVVRANIVLFFGCTTLITLTSYFASGLLTRDVGALALLIAPAYGLPLYLGMRLFDRASEMYFRRACYVLIVAALVVGLPVFDTVLR